MSHLTHQYNAKKAFLKTTYKGFVKHDDFVKISNKSIDLLIKHEASKLLVDTSKLKVMPPENQEWIQKYWFPKAAAIGLQKMAFITPENIFGEVSAKATNEKGKQYPIEIAYFSTQEEAERWLLN